MKSRQWRSIRLYFLLNLLFQTHHFRTSCDQKGQHFSTFHPRRNARQICNSKLPYTYPALFDEEWWAFQLQQLLTPCVSLESVVYFKQWHLIVLPHTASSLPLIHCHWYIAIATCVPTPWQVISHSPTDISKINNMLRLLIVPYEGWFHAWQYYNNAATPMLISYTPASLNLILMNQKAQQRRQRETWNIQEAEEERMDLSFLSLQGITHHYVTCHFELKDTRQQTAQGWNWKFLHPSLASQCIRIAF